MTGYPRNFSYDWQTVLGLKMGARVSTNPPTFPTVPIVLLHGLGVSSRYMLPTADRLATQYRVLVPELPGFGASERPPHALDIPLLADLLSKWLEAVAVPRAVFLGNSLGCQVIVDLAVRYPHQVHAAILVGPTVDSVGHSMSRQFWRGFRELFREPWSLWPILARDYWAMGTKRLLETFRFALDDPVHEKFARMSVPTLVVRGSRDLIAPQRWVEEVVRALPHGFLAVIPDGTHATNYSAPAELVSVTSEFLAKLGQLDNVP